MNHFKENLRTKTSSRLGGGALENKRKKPEGLKKFTKHKKQKQILIGAIIVLTLVIGGISLYKTFAIYEEHTTFDVLKGTIPNFKKTDIQLAITLDGKMIDKIPQKEDGKYYNVDVKCDNDALGIWNYSKWNVEVSNFKNNTECSVAFTTLNEKDPTLGRGEIYTILTIDYTTIEDIELSTTQADAKAYIDDNKAIVMTSPQNSGPDVTVWTTNSFDLSDYRYAIILGKLDRSSSYGSNTIGFSEHKDTNFVVKDSNSNKGNFYTLLDISELKGSYYFVATIPKHGYSSTTSIQSILLIK